MAISRRGHVGQGQCRAFPQQAGRALAGRVQTLQMKRVLAGAQAQRAAIKTHCIARRVANLGKRRPGLGHFHAVDHQPSAIASQQVKCIAAVSGNIDEAVPRGGVMRIALRIRSQARPFAGKDRALCGKVRQLGPFSGINLPCKAGDHGAGGAYGIVPVSHGHQPVRRPVLGPVAILNLEQNPKAARAGSRPIQLSSLGIRKAMAHATTAGLRAVAEKPCVMRAGRGLRGKCDHLSRSKDRRGHGERRHRAVPLRKMRLLRAVARHQRQISIRGRAALPILHIVEDHARHVAGHRGIGQRRLIQRPDVAEGEPVQSRVFLLHLRQRVPIVQKKIFKLVVGVNSLGPVCAPQAEQGEGLPACPDAAVKNVGVAQGEIARVEGLARPAGAHNVRDAGGKHAVFNENVPHIVAGTQHRLVRIAVPVALHHKNIIRGADKGIAHHGVAAAQPVHAILVGVPRIAADHPQIVIHKSRRIFHLDRPRPRPHNTGQPIDLHVVCLHRADAMPVRLLHPAFIAVGVLRPVIHNGSASQNFYILNLPQIQAAEKVRAGSQVKCFAALGIETSVVDPRLIGVNLWIARQGRRRRAGKEKQHLGIVQKIAGARDGELGRPAQPEANRLASSRRPQSQPPWLNVHAFVPEALLGSGNLHHHRAGHIEADVLIVRRGVGHVHRLSVHSDGKGRRTHLRRNRRSLHAVHRVGSNRKREKSYKQRTKSQQKESPAARWERNHCNTRRQAVVSDSFAHRDVLPQPL